MKEKMNNKGFSLVELIIVIAIMAILLVVLAPQYLKYVERSRNSTDLQNATEIVTALQVYASDPEATVPPNAAAAESIAIPAVGGAAPTLSTFAEAALKDAGLLDTGDTLQTKCQSKTAWTSYTITWSVVDGNLQFTYTSTPGGTPDPFATRMAGGN